MKVSVDRLELKSALDAVGKIIAERNGIPILKNIHLSSDLAVLFVHGTDLALSIRTGLQASVSTPGETTVPSAILRDVVGRGLAPQITLSADEKRMSVACGSLRVSLPVLPATDYPQFDDGFSGPFIDVLCSGSQLTKLIGRVMFAVGNDINRPYLNGVWLRADDEYVCAAAGDGMRLAVSYLEDEIIAAAIGDTRIIIPDRVAKEILRLFGTQNVNMRFDERKIVVVGPTMTLTSSLVAATQPEFSHLIEEKPEAVVTTVDLKKLRAATEAVGVVDCADKYGVYLEFSSGSVLASSFDPDHGEASASIPAEYSGEPFKIGFPTRQLAAALGAVEGSTCKIASHGPYAPAIFRNADDESFISAIGSLRK